MNYEGLTIEEQRARTVGEILNLWEKHDRVLCVRYMQFGKTYYIIRKLLDIYGNKKFLIVAHSNSLIERYGDLFSQFSNARYTTYQKLSRLDFDKLNKLYSDLDFVIYDECHHLGASKWGNHANYLSSINNHIKTLGLTATEERLDGIDIINDFFKGVMTTKLSLIDGINSGHIPMIDYVIAYCDITKLKEYNDPRMTEVDRYTLNNLVNVPEILKKHIDDFRLNNVLKIFVFLPSLDDMDIAEDNLYKWFNEIYPNKNLQFFKQNSRKNKEYNRDQLDAFIKDSDNRNIDIMLSVNMLNEGIRTKYADIAILLRKTVSKTVYYQQLGRILNDNKPLVFDLVDNEKNINKLRTDFKSRNSESSLNIEKKMFFENINLIDETVDIRDILSKYSTYYGEQRDVILNNIEYIKEQLLHGTPVLKISKSIGVSPEYVSKVITELGIYTRGEKAKSVDYEKLKECIMPYIEQGYDMEYTSKKLGKSLWSIRKCISIYGLEFKTSRSRNTKEFVRDNWDNMSMTDMAKELGVTLRTIQRAATDLGFREKSGAHYTEDMKKFIIDAYNSGMSLHQIQLNYRYHYDSVAGILKEAGIYNPLPKQEYYKNERAKTDARFEKIKDSLIQDYVGGMKIRDVQNKYNITERMLTRYLKEWGIPTKRDAKLNKFKEFADKNKESIVEDYNNGMPIEQIYKAYNTSRYVIEKILGVGRFTQNK